MSPIEANRLVEQAVNKCVNALLMDWSLHRATVFVRDTLTIKATRTCERDSRARAETFVVSYGTPNYAEQAFIKSCKRAGEPFPVKKIQLKYYPMKRKAA